MNRLMAIAVKEAFKGIDNNEGGPFGAVIVKDGEIISRAHNEVIKTNDPTAHAEIVAIRKASKKLKRFGLSDCEIYSSCKPCPMCISAIIWARIPVLYYGCTAADAENIGFIDKFIYDFIRGKVFDPDLKEIQIDREECLKPFKKWASIDRIQY